MADQSYIEVGLDTTAPVVTWGPVDGADADQDFEILYTVDEPELVSAELQLPDGRVLEMTVLADRLAVHLPADSPRGLGTVSAFVRDELGNTATRTTTVALDGVIPVEPPTVPTGGGFPLAPARRPAVEIRRWRTRAATGSRYNVAVAVPGVRTRAETRSRYRVVETSRVRLSVLDARTRFGRANRHVQVTLAGTATRYAVSKRAEGPEAEAELLLLL